jgi:hypothetical protein
MTDASDEDLQLYPAWREAVEKFLGAGFEPDKVIQIDWFYAALSIEKPAPEMPLRDAEKLKAAFLGEFERMRSALLVEHNIALDNVWGKGYRIVPSTEQTDWAEREGHTDVKRSLKKLGTRLSFVDLTALSEKQRRDNADALARFSLLTGMVDDVRRRKVIAPSDGAE